jgi:cytochrome c oxidase subunit 2
MKQIPVALLTLVAGVVVTLVSLWYGQNHGLMPEQASVQAPLVDRFFNVMLTIGTALFLVVEGAIVIFVIQYRQRPGDTTDGVPIEGNLPLEAFWTAIPAIIVIGLGIYSVAIFQEMGATNPGDHAAMAHARHGSTLVAQAPGSESVGGDVMPLLASAPEGTGSPPTREYGVGAVPTEAGQIADVVVNVTGMQYAWLFNYPEGNFVAGELHVPVGKDVQLNLTSPDVIHSFWVPQFRMKQDVMPGLTTELRFVATKVSSYPIVCTELCGSYHDGMRSTVVVHSQADYDQWLADNQVAQRPESQPAIALQPVDRSDAEFLAPYAETIGVGDGAIAQLHHAAMP